MNTATQLKTPCLSPNITKLLLVSISAVPASAIAATLSIVFMQRSLAITSMLIFFVVAASLSGLFVGLFYWRRFILGRGRITVGRGILYGILSSLIAHPIAMGFAQLLAAITGTPIFGPFQLPGILANIAWLPVFSLVSLIWVGWLTAIVGAVAGGLIVYLQRAIATICPHLLTE